MIQEYMSIIQLGLIFFVIFLVFFLVKRTQDIKSLTLLVQNLNQQQINSQVQLNQRLATQETHLSESLHARFQALGDKVGVSLDKTNTTTLTSLGQLRERLSVIDHAQQKIADLSQHVVNLKEIFSNKQARGAFGEIQLYDLVTSILPPSAYGFQETLSNGKRPDCLIKLPYPPGSIAIDSKFPLESYRSLINAPTAAEKAIVVRQFKIDMTKHIDVIAEKYILSAETADSALLFLPSERIYADLHTDFTDIVEYAFKTRVFIVSPTTLMATLNTIRSVLKDARLHEESKLIQREVGILLKDMNLLVERVDKLDTHFGQAQEDLRLVKISSEKIIKRSERIENLEDVEGGELEAAHEEKGIEAA